MSEKCNDAELKIDQACPLCYLVTSHEEQDKGSCSRLSQHSILCSA